MIKTYKYRLYPNYKQRLVMQKTLDICRELFNLCLEQRKMQHIHEFEQSRQLTQLKKIFPEYTQVCDGVLRVVLSQLEHAFQSFFRRVKRGQKSGYPRFKSENRFSSFCFPTHLDKGGSFRLSGEYLQLTKIGNVKVRLHRKIPNDARFICCTVLKKNGNWYACFDIECATTTYLKSDLQVGIDVGIINFITFSDRSISIPNPRFYENSQKQRAKLQRKVARKVKGSNRRKKAKLFVSKFEEHIANKRRDFLHKLSQTLVNKYGIIVVEDLNVAGMIRSNLAKYISDCSWSSFFGMLDYKAEWAGNRQIQRVPARYTSQKCSECGFISAENRKTQSEFKCLSCEFCCDADLNASKNILSAWIELSSVNVTGSDVCVA